MKKNSHFFDLTITSSTLGTMFRNTRIFRSDILFRNSQRGMSRLPYEKKSKLSQVYAELSLFMNKRLLLLRGAMTRKRVLNLMFIKSTNRAFSYSDVAGHGAFLCLALSYLETDFLTLRLYAASGVTLSIIFQYYRAVPLWIPIRWNALFLFINFGMIGLLLKKANDAQKIPDEQKELFSTTFQKLGMMPMEFLHLMSVATRHEFAKGEKLVIQGEKRTHLHFVKSGKGAVIRDGIRIGSVSVGQFVGEMSFLAWENAETEKERLRKEKGLSSDFERITGDISKWLQNAVATSHAVCGGSSGAASNEEPKLESQETSESSQSSSHVRPAGPCNDFSFHKSTLSTTEVTGVTDGTTITNGTVPVTVTSPAHPTSSEVDKVLLKKQKFLLGNADVVCEEDCVIYSWSFKGLHNIISANPSIGVSVERCISSDLNKVKKVS